MTAMRSTHQHVPVAQHDSGGDLAEIAEILAAGLMRLEAPKSSQLSAHAGESSLHISPDQSGPANANSPEVAA